VIVNIPIGFVFLVSMQVSRYSTTKEMCTNHFTCVTSVAVTLVLMKIQVVWDIIPC
jgi:hypothetical protein